VANCLLRDASGVAVESSDYQIQLSADASVVEVEPGLYQFNEVGTYNINCTISNTNTSQVVEVTKEVEVAVEVMPDALMTLSEVTGNHYTQLDLVESLVQAGDASSLLEIVQVIDAGNSLLEQLINNNETDLFFPIPGELPTENECATAGYPLESGDQVVDSNLADIGSKIQALRNTIGELDSQTLDASAILQVNNQLDLLKTAFNDYEALDLSPCGTLFSKDQHNEMLGQQLYPFILEMGQFSSAYLEAVAQYVQQNGGLKFSLVGISTSITMQQAIYKTVMNWYGPYLKAIARYAATIFLADLVEMFWDPVPGGPFIDGEITSGGMTDVCDGWPVNRFFGGSFGESGQIPDPVSIGVVIVAQAQVTAIEGILSSLDCGASSCDDKPPAQKNICKAKKYYDCYKNISKKVKEAEGVFSDAAPEIVSVEEFADGSIQFEFVFPYEVSSMIGMEPVFIFPWSAITGNGQKWQGNLISCP
jgi:PKD repeat protein